MGLFYVLRLGLVFFHVHVPCGFEGLIWFWFGKGKRVASNLRLYRIMYVYVCKGCF